MSGHVQLWHYTCDHGRRHIGDVGALQPNRGRVWLTDLAEPDRDALGLTMRLLTCDRTQHRYRVLDDAGAVPYHAVRLAEFTADQRDELETGGGLLRHWWIATTPVPVMYDPATVEVTR